MAKIYSKSDLVKTVAEQLSVAQIDVKTVLDAALADIAAKTNEGLKVNLAGFGGFVVKERAARVGRNPATGEAIEIAASKSLTFKATKPTK